MSLFDKLNDITPENRADVFKSLTPRDFERASENDWILLFEEMAKLPNQKIEDKKALREIQRDIYPFYQISLHDKDVIEKRATQTFEKLIHNPAVQHAFQAWETALPEERVDLIQQVVTHLAEAMPYNFGQFRIETFNQPSKDGKTLHGYVNSGEKNIFHINSNPAVFENTPLACVLGTCYHEMTHLGQEKAQREGELSAVAASSNSTLYFRTAPHNLKALEEAGYRFDIRKEYRAYRAQPNEAEASLSGDLMQQHVENHIKTQSVLMDNPYMMQEAEAYCQQNRSIKLGGISEDTNPYHHLIAGDKAADEAIKEKFIDYRKNNISYALKHYQATIRHGEFLSDSPAPKAIQKMVDLSLEPAFQSHRDKEMMMSIIKKTLNRYENSPNKELSGAVQIASAHLQFANVSINGGKTLVQKRQELREKDLKDVLSSHVVQAPIRPSGPQGKEGEASRVTLPNIRNTH